MKKFYLMLLMIAATMTALNAQNSADTITVKKVTGGYQYLKGDITLTMPQLVEAVSSNPVAYEKIKSVPGTYALVMGLSYAGGAFIGYPIGTMIGGGEPQWVLAGIGAAILAVAFPMAKSLDNKMKQAVDIYNSDIQKTSFWDQTELRLSMTGNGVGLILRF